MAISAGSATRSTIPPRSLKWQRIHGDALREQHDPGESDQPDSGRLCQSQFSYGPAVSSGNNYIDSTPTHLNQDSYQIRVDQTFGEHDSLFGRVSHYNEPQIGSNGYAGASSFANDYGWNAVMHETHTFSPTAVMDGFFGRNLGNADTGSNVPGAPAGFAKQLIQLGVSANFVSNFQGGQGPFIPGMGVTGYLGRRTAVRPRHPRLCRQLDVWR